MEGIVMKKILFVFLCAACALTFFSCQKEENANEEVTPEGYSQLTLSAVSDETRTTLDGTTVKWATGDKIKVYCSDGSASDFTLVGEGGSSSGDFTGFVPSGKTALYAVYPKDLYSSVSSTTVNVTIPASQEGTFGDGNIAVAKVDGETHNMAFKNVNAFVGFNVPSGATKVVISSVGGQNLSGTLAVDCSGENPTAGALSDGGSSITVTFPVSTGGTYYVAIAPGIEHTKGLLLTWYSGEDVTGTYWLNKAITTAANNVYDMGGVSTSGDYYVTVDGGSSVKNGMSWATAWSASQFWSKIHPGGTDTEMDNAKLANINGATFHLAAGTYNWGTGAAININESETIAFTIKGESGTIFTGDDDNDDTGDHRILSLGGNMNVTFDGITFDDGYVDGNGGAVAIANGQWKFTGCAFSGNEASGNGGAIDLSGGSASIYKSTFNGNNAGVNGGAISVAEGAKVEILHAASNTQFISNVATGKGGALFIESKNGDLVMEHSTPNNRINYADFKRNHADYGGAVAVCGESGKASRVFFSNCTMGSNSSSDANFATKDGGAIYFEGECFVNVGNSTVRRNYATAKGGAISVAGWGKLQLYRSYFNRNYAKTGGVVYTEGADSKYADFFVDECSFEANYITEHYGCVFNINGINEFSMYNSSAKDSYTTGTGKKDADKKGLCPSWIAIDAVQAGGCVSMANCSIIGDTWHGTDNVALTDGTALIAVWGTQTNYFTNCIIVPETESSIAAIRGDGDEVIDLYYTHYSSIGNTATPIDSDGNTTGCQASDFGSLTWSSNCWTWDGQINGVAPTMATRDGVYNRINTICPDFVTWSGSDFDLDQRHEGRGNGDWWPGAYQNNE